MPLLQRPFKRVSKRGLQRAVILFPFSAFPFVDRKPVANTRFGKKQIRSARIIFQLLPQLCHIDTRILRLTLQRSGPKSKTVFHCIMSSDYSATPHPVSLKCTLTKNKTSISLSPIEVFCSTCSGGRNISELTTLGRMFEYTL